MHPLEFAEKELNEPGVTCVVVRGDNTVRSREHGIRPLVRLLRENPECLRGAFVADKVVGKAAAMLMIYGQIAGVYAAVISRSAAAVLTEHAVPFRFAQKEEIIQNKERTGMCPMERRAEDCRTPEEAYRLFSGMIPGR